MMNGGFSQWDRMAPKICTSWMYNSIFYLENRMGRPWVIYYDSILPFLFIIFSWASTPSCMCVITNMLCFMLPLSPNKRKPMGLICRVRPCREIYVVCVFMWILSELNETSSFLSIFRLPSIFISSLILSTCSKLFKPYQWTGKGHYTQTMSCT